MYHFFIISAIFNALISSLLGFLILFKNAHNRINRSFFYFCLSVAVWSLFYIGWPIARTAEGTVLSFRLLHLGAIFTPVTYFHFVINWLDLYQKRKKSIYGAYVLAIIFCISVFTPFFISGVSPKFNMRFWAEPGLFYHLYLVYFFTFVLYSSLLLYKKSRKATLVKKQQIKYILIGMLLSFLGGSTNYFLWYDINIPPYGNILASSFVIFAAYVIITKRFLGVTLVVRKSGVYFFSLWTLLLLVFFLDAGLSVLRLDQYFLVDFCLIVFSIFAFRYTKKFYYYLANRYFFYSLYQPGKLISSISDKLIRTLKPVSIYNFIFNKLAEVFMLKTFVLLKYERNQGAYKMIYSRGCQTKEKIYQKDDFLEKEYFEEGEPVVRGELDVCHISGKKDGLCKLISKNIDIVMPLTSKKRIIGLMLLGPKGSQDFYNVTDVNTLKVIAAQLASAIESRELYNRIYDLNRSLAQRVEKQTKDIRKKAQELKENNKRLEKLLEMKSDFLRLVNHQLNTPISIIRNSIFMIREESFTQEKGLTYIEEGIKRMEEITHDFWKAFAFEGESIKVEKRKTDISKIVKGLVEESREMSVVKERKLKINLDTSFKVPAVLCDPKELKQAISNLLNNSISYTKKGQIDIYYEKLDDFLKVYIKDTGCGIDEQDVGKIFDKFTRGQRGISNRPAGSGLGLYISKEIISACDGKLKLEETQPGKGTTFSLTVPLYKK